MPSGIYHGRLVTDGDGNLLADEGEFAGWPVAYHEGSYVFVQPGEPSHNERHHQQFAEFTGTVDVSMVDPDDPTSGDLVNAGDGANMHHFEVQEDDPNYDADAPGGFKTKFTPDAAAATETGHTDAEAYKNV